MSGQSDKKGCLVLVESSNHKIHDPWKGIRTLVPPARSPNTLSQLLPPCFAKLFLDCLRICPTLLRKPHSMSNKSLHTLLMQVWYYVSWYLNQILWWWVSCSVGWAIQSASIIYEGNIQLDYDPISVSRLKYMDHVRMGIFVWQILRNSPNEHCLAE